MKDLEEKIKTLHNPITVKNILAWLSEDCNHKDQEEIRYLLEKNPQSLDELFGRTLVFGTGGLRSPMGLGTNRMNVFTVRRTTQGLAQVLKRHNPHPGDPIYVVIGYDTRKNSLEFAQETARVLAANHIHALLFQDPEPLSLVSFTVREERALAGVMITASHNPPEYNGYKVYMASGGQVLPPLDKEIIEELVYVNRVEITDSLNNDYVHSIGEEYENRYREVVKTFSLYPQDNRFSGTAIHISYSPLHGTGVSLIPKVLKDWGFSQVQLVEQQAVPDGSFPTVRLPNPEDPEALELGIQQMLENKDDIFIASDPDADRLGVVCLDNNEAYIFNGNQIACLLADHILRALSSRSPLDEESKVVKSLVTTEMLTTITNSYGGSLVNVATGFKYIGEKIESWRNNKSHYIFGAEESYGYLYGTHVEDKDAVSSAALVAEAALQCKLQGKTLRDAILDLYEAHGYFMNRTIAVSLSQHEEEILSRMKELVEYHPSTMSLNNNRVQKFENYYQGVGKDFTSHTTYDLTLPKTSMFCYYYENGGRIIIRPSGTESKVKFYFEIVNRYPTVENNRKLKEHREQESLQILEGFITEFQEKFTAIGF
ncbi:Phosphoglucomutase [Chlamydia avium]|nr:Phosphoglucomutase [Chlamydia avium]